MALSKEENDMLTQVGPGKPAGSCCGGIATDWFANELQVSEEEADSWRDVVLFKDEFGKYGVLALRCMHRGTSLEFGHIESGGFAVAIMAGCSTSTARCWKRLEKADEYF